jgi:hypothetical protein
VKDIAFFGTLSTLLAVVSHYDSIDLQAVGTSITASRSDEEFDALEWAAILATDALAQLVSLEAVLQGHDM